MSESERGPLIPEFERGPWRVAHLELMGRRDEMQDASETVVVENDGRPTLVSVVADGHGADGAWAARAALTGALDRARTEKNINDPAFLRELFKDMHSAFVQQGLKGGATLSVATLRDSRLIVAYVGDSEVRRVRNDGQNELLTIPHRAHDHIEEHRRLKATGVLDVSGAIRPRNGYEYIAITRTLGDAEFEPFVSHEPEIIERTLGPDTRFLIIASDGLWDAIKNAPQGQKTFAEAIKDAVNADDAKQKIESLLNAWNLRNQDNATAEIIEIPL